jgi:hypothetical protein
MFSSIGTVPWMLAADSNEQSRIHAIAYAGTSH